MKEKRKRRCWVAPLNSTRLNEGEFHLKFQHLRRDSKKFFEYYRMSVKTFDELLSDISSQLSKANTNMRLAVSPAEKLASTLRYLGSGCTFCELHKSFRLGTSTVGAIVREVCSAIWQLLVRKYMPVPTSETWLEVAKGFETNSNFPHCIGAIDGKYIQVMKNTSIVLLAVADTSYQFIYIYVCPDVKHTDLTIFERSSLWQKLANNSLNIPKPEPLLNAEDGKKMPYVFVGDKLVRFSDHILRPYAVQRLPMSPVAIKRRVFNYRLERARRNVECAFAILSNKWRIFQRPLNVASDLMRNITKACCVLHNYVIQKEGFVFDDSLVLSGIHDLNVLESSRGPKLAYEIRDYFATYFMNDNAVPWQTSFLEVDQNTDDNSESNENDNVANEIVSDSSALDVADVENREHVSVVSSNDVAHSDNPENRTEIDEASASVKLDKQTENGNAIDAFCEIAMEMDVDVSDLVSEVISTVEISDDVVENGVSFSNDSNNALNDDAEKEISILGK